MIFWPVGAPKLKDFKVIEFTGEEQHSGLGADWDSFKYQFDVQIQTLEIFDLVVWKEEHRLSAMAMCFRGAAFGHFKYLADRGLTANYDSVCRSIKNRFCCKLSQSQLGKLLEEPKRTNATWKSHIEYMRAVASRMGGNPSKIILEYFCSYSCPSEEKSLLAKIDQDSSEYGTELEKATRYLTSITGNGK